MIDRQVIHFLIAGSVNTIVYYVLFSVFIYLGVDYRFSVLFATVIGVLFSFKTFSKFVFSNDDNRLIFRFIAVYVVLYLCNVTIVYISNMVVGNYYISGFIATILCAILSFVLNKQYVFKENKNG